ncbi:MAG: alpha-amylase family glycosyl hydrolase [Anaerolineae bacterium]
MVKLYGKKEGPLACQKLLDLMSSYRTRVPVGIRGGTTEKDTILITYGDMVQQGSEKPLITLNKFLNDTIAGTVSSVHLLPFYPWTSDDGFSVSDYRQVDPALGSWQDVRHLGNSFRMMFDAVINHISSESEWFQSFLRDEKPFNSWFHVVDPQIDLTKVFRPRSGPLLTAFDTTAGTSHVWTTFGPDQVDLNFGNSEVMIAIIDVLLNYVSRGAEFIRLDAIGFLWKKPETNCIHLPETHAAIQLMREVLNIMAPHVCLITETNMSHKQNVSYFGNGTNEAAMVYNFPLPPLTMHAFHTGDTHVLSDWASSLKYPSDEANFFNFMASHDGIGVTPVRGILKDEEIKLMGERVKALGGRISYKDNPDGTKDIYELNINFLNSLAKPGKLDETPVKAKRFLASQAIMLAFKGVPGIYFNSLYGSENWVEGAEQTGRNRTINREKVRYADISADLNDIDSLRSRVFYPYRHMIAVRSSEPAFSPTADQQVFMLHRSLFCILRGQGHDSVLCIQNVTPNPVSLEANMRAIFGESAGWYRNILNNDLFEETLVVEPFGVLWLKLH